MTKLPRHTTVAHVIARPGEREAAAMFTCDDLHELYERVSALEDLLEDVAPILAVYASELEALRRGETRVRCEIG